jgi:hypothetical protein
MYPASSSKLNVIPNPTQGQNAPTFFIGIATKKQNEAFCTSGLDLLLIHFQHVTSAFSGKDFLASIMLWYNSWIGYAPHDQHANQVRDEIESMAKSFITDWNLANK